MGMLVDGQWTTKWYEPDSEGRFVRPETGFRNWISDAPDAAHPAQAGRYHVYASYACPWAHRVLIGRVVLGLEELISVSIVDPLMGDAGWVFSNASGCIPDSVHGAEALSDVYLAARRDYTGRVTVPVLWDKHAGTIVNNESREILRMLGTAMLPHATRELRLFDPTRQPEIDAVIDAIYEPINNGVYRAGFATTQRAYEEAVGPLFDALDHWDDVLSRQAYLTGDALSEADVCLFTTLVRFDAVYHGHFKCNRRRIADYEHLSRLMRAVYELPGVEDTVNMDHIKRHYYWSHTSINPTRVVPVGPDTIWR